MLPLKPRPIRSRLYQTICTSYSCPRLPFDFVQISHWTVFKFLQFLILRKTVSSSVLFISFVEFQTHNKTFLQPRRHHYLLLVERAQVVIHWIWRKCYDLGLFTVIRCSPQQFESAWPWIKKCGLVCPGRRRMCQFCEETATQGKPIAIGIFWYFFNACFISLLLFAIIDFLIIFVCVRQP